MNTPDGYTQVRAGNLICQGDLSFDCVAGKIASLENIWIGKIVDGAWEVASEILIIRKNTAPSTNPKDAVIKKLAKKLLDEKARRVKLVGDIKDLLLKEKPLASLGQIYDICVKDITRK